MAAAPTAVDVAGSTLSDSSGGTPSVGALLLAAVPVAAAVDLRQSGGVSIGKTPDLMQHAIASSIKVSEVHSTSVLFLRVPA